MTALQLAGLCPQQLGYPSKFFSTLQA